MSKITVDSNKKNNENYKFQTILYTKALNPIQ
jgi:hypothetical protein